MVIVVPPSVPPSPTAPDELLELELLLAKPDEELLLVPASPGDPDEELLLAPASLWDPDDELLLAPASLWDPDEELLLEPASLWDPDDELLLAPASLWDPEEELLDAPASMCPDDVEEEVDAAPELDELLDLTVEAPPWPPLALDVGAVPPAPAPPVPELLLQAAAAMNSTPSIPKAVFLRIPFLSRPPWARSWIQATRHSFSVGR